MITNYTKRSYILRGIDKQKVYLPLHIHNLSTDGKFINENTDETKYKISPSSYYQTGQHIIVAFYKSIL
jgi:hypothetical protein